MRSNADEIARVFDARNVAGNIPDLPEIYPDQNAPVIRSVDEGRVIETFTWGFPPPGQVKRPVTNVRNLESPFWLSALKRPERRCLVPVTAFCEWTGPKGAKTKVWFDLIDDPLFAFAGIWRPVEGKATRFAFLTCAPNDIVGAVHPKAMPVILTPSDAEIWLREDWRVALNLVSTYPSRKMRSNDRKLL
ncbi:putative SOS response-associated peptidase YedK [Pacificimonas flava]|uniref:Abasic site processing protein n=2 Tax=Pacificimonas flava TaxID=1234595 RepID=M2U1W3_9SPHN|nr:hypothetical protein C725_2846 [Pacificimonas flava]MBB5281670.1 putative SOS response-associated peptidase YedK [Pacificimonas flava]